ncbi:MAG: phosphatidylglycerophosphatase A [Candidatus Omnitrophota bacterium]
MGKPQDYSKILIKSISTFFFIGYLPVAPGTFGSLAGVGLFYLLKESGINPLIVTSGLIILGFLVTEKAEKLFAKKDPSFVVIDEVAGMFLSLLFLPVYDIKVLIIAFFYFRLIDTFKPFPAGRVEKMKGALGLMGDDIVAAVYTNIILQLVLRLTFFKTS